MKKIIFVALFGLFIFINTLSSTTTYEAPNIELKKKEVLLEVTIDWKPERVIQEIQTVFPDAPVMVEIARCESNFLPHAQNKKTIDSGIFQLNEASHGARLRALHLDPFDVQDNIKYARMLYDESGTAPWKSSRHCWSK